MEIKLLLLDMDDTLINSKGQISKRTIKAVNCAVEQGVTVALASGRMYASLLQYLGILNTHGPVVSYNGALIKNSVTDETIYYNPVPVEYAREILGYAQEIGIHCQFYDEKSYYFESADAITDGYCKLTGIKGMALGEDLSKKIEFNPIKLLYIEDRKDILLSAFEEVKKKFGDELHVTLSTGRYIEFMNKGVNKGEALKKLCEMLSVPLENSMAIGDGLNDLEMIKYAGIGVAVGTAEQELKDAADIVCESADAQGPAKIIEQYVLRS